MLYIVATPIGNLDELSPRALKILQTVDIIAAEDTRHSRKLCQHFGIKTPLIAYHQHNEQQQTQQLIEKLEQGKNIALISDAGMPLISDPGYQLTAQLRNYSTEQIKIEVISGPCALVNALAGSGLATDHFSFEGFLSNKSVAREKQLVSLAKETRTLVFYETPHRLAASLSAMATQLGGSRKASVARELTKLHESWYHDSLENLSAFFNDNPDHCRGEIVVVVEGAVNVVQSGSVATDQVMALLVKELPPNKTAAIMAKLTGRSKKEIYKEIIG